MRFLWIFYLYISINVEREIVLNLHVSKICLPLHSFPPSPLFSLLPFFPSLLGPYSEFFSNYERSNNIFRFILYYLNLKMLLLFLFLSSFSFLFFSFLFFSFLFFSFLFFFSFIFFRSKRRGSMVGRGRRKGREARKGIPCSRD